VLLIARPIGPPTSLGSGCGSLELKLSFHACGRIGVYMLLLLLRLLTPSEEAIQPSAVGSAAFRTSLGGKARETLRKPPALIRVARLCNCQFENPGIPYPQDSIGLLK
jgi:hypothetical protein